MLKKTMTYKNLDGAEVTEDFYFNMTKAELIKLNIREGEGFQDYLTKIVESGDGAAIIETFEKLIGLAYGEKIDGKFAKIPGAFAVFQASEAYSDFFYELVTDGKVAAEFIQAVMPDDLVVQAQQTQNNVGISENLKAHLEIVPENVQDTISTNVFERAKAGTSKDLLAIKMAIKTGKPIKIKEWMIDALTANELNMAMQNGSTIDE